MSAGDKANWADVADAIRPPLVRLVQQAAQSLTSGVAAAITFGAGSEEIDTHNFHDTVTNNTRITPTKAGYYRLTGQVNIVAGTALVQILGLLRKNGANVDPLMPWRPDAASNAATCAIVTAMVSMNGTTDYVELICQQNSGGAINTNAAAGQRSVFELEYRSPL